MSCTGTRTLAGVLGFCVAYLCGCEMTGDRQAKDEGAVPARHAVHSQQLQGVMRSLQGQVARTWPQEMAEEKAATAERDRERRFREARELAKALAGAAESIPEAVADVAMTQADREAFMANVSMLKEQASQLETAAAVRDVQRMRSALSQIQTTCLGCHERFSEHTGPLSFGKGH